MHAGYVVGEVIGFVLVLAVLALALGAVVLFLVVCARLAFGPRRRPTSRPPSPPDDWDDWDDEEYIARHHH